MKTHAPHGDLHEAWRAGAEQGSTKPSRPIQDGVDAASVTGVPAAKRSAEPWLSLSIPLRFLGRPRF